MRQLGTGVQSLRSVWGIAMRAGLIRAGILIVLSLAVWGCGGGGPDDPVQVQADAAIPPDASACPTPLCGGECCKDGESCEDGVCRGCEAETDEAFCARLEKKCGEQSGTDNCSQPRHVASCGECADGLECNAAGECVAVEGCEDDAQFCARNQRRCGAFTGTDNCGVARSVEDCGACPTDETCEEATGTCRCAPESDAQLCARNDRVCGSFSGVDNCSASRTVKCGACGANEKCDEATNRCQACDDDAAFCHGKLAQCGPLNGQDNCGNIRSAECGKCPPGQQCDGLNLCGACTAEDDASFCQRLAATCGTVTGDDNCGLSRTVASCGICFSPQSCLVDHTCGAPPVPGNNTCAGAEPLELDATGHVRAHGDTTSATGKMKGGSCNSASGTDVVYLLDLDSPKHLEITVTPTPGSKLSPNVYVVTTCEDQATQLPGACRRTGTVAPLALGLKNVPRGTYYIWVDGWSSSSNGPFTIDVQAFDVEASPPRNDSCNTPETLTFDANGQAHAEGRTFDATNAYAASCAGTSSSDQFTGGDLVYRFNLGRESAVAITLRSAALATGLSLRSSSCAEAAEKGCVASGSSVAILSFPTLPAGDHYVFVDGLDGTHGTFSLDVRASQPVSNTTCDHPEELTFDASGLAATVGDTSLSNYSAEGTCNSSSGRDLVYTFQTSNAHRLEAVVTPLADSLLQPNLYLRSACGEKGAELACTFERSVVPGTLIVERLNPGTYYLFVDGYSSATNGAFSLAVTRSDPPAPIGHDTCRGAQLLTLDPATRKVTVNGTTREAGHDYAGSCAGASGHGGPDVVYTFHLDRNSGFVAKVTRDPASTNFKPALYLRRDCLSSAATDELGCGNMDGNGVAIVDLPSLAEGDYSLIVDGLGGSFGDFTLELQASAPFTNDSCVSPELLTFVNGVATVSSTLRHATDDGDGLCNSSSGVDVVYMFVTSSELKFQAVATPDAMSAVRPNLYLRTSCQDQATELACVKTSDSGTPVSLVVNRLPAGTYYLWADSYMSSSRGPFTMTVTLIDPTNAPGNDVCSGSELLPIDSTTRKVKVVGNTSEAANRYKGNCPTSASMAHTGPDLVYRLELDSDARLKATVTRDAASPDFKPVVYVRRDCEDVSIPNELACGASNSGVSTVSVTWLPQGVYYLFVDGQQGTSGGFTLDVETAPALKNDTCAEPEPLVFDASGIARVSADTTNATRTNDGTCNSASGPDLVYSFELSGTKDIEVVVTPATGSGYRPNLYVRRDCELKNTELACVAAPREEITGLFLPGLGQGKYYLWVDGYNGTNFGAFTMTVTATEPPDAPVNNICRGAIELDFDSVTRQAVVDGDTRHASNDTAGTCADNYNALNGGEVFYQLNLTQAAMVIAKVTRAATASTYLPAVYIRSDCESDLPADEKACARQSSGVATAMVRALPRGTYYVVVDGAQGTRGEFTLEVSLLPPLTNDNCTLPDELVFDGGGVARVRADNTWAIGDMDGTCNGGSGPDLVYTFTLSADKAVAVEMAAASGSTIRPNVYLRRTECGVKTAQVACALATANGGTASLSIPMLGAGTYFVWADSYGSSSKGEFDLTVTLSAPAKPSPANDVCTGATQLGLDATTKAVTLTDQETVYAHNDYAGTCDASAGGDLVYTFTTIDPHKLVAKVTRDASTSTFTPVVYLRRDCGPSGSAGEVTCVKGSGATTIATVNNLAAGTWYLFVDGVDYPGKFNLEVTLSDPASGPANESCYAPQLLQFTGDTVQVTGTTLGAQSEATGSCAAAGAPDVVYYFSTSDERRITAKVTPVGTSYQPAIYMRPNCSSSDELFCVKASKAGAEATGIVKRAPASTYYLWVDGVSSSTSGDFTLEVTAAIPPPRPVNNTCASATQLAFGVQVSGDTSEADLTYGPNLPAACSSRSVKGPDVVYSYTPTADGAFTVKLTPSNFDAVLWYSVGTCSMAGCVADADKGGIGAAESLTVTNGVAGTTYYFFVDGYNEGSAGTFTLVVVP